MEHRKDNRKNKSDGARSRDMDRIWAELFRKVKKYQKYQKGSRKGQKGQGRARKGMEGPERAWKGRERNFCLEMHQQGLGEDRGLGTLGGCG